MKTEAWAIKLQDNTLAIDNSTDTPVLFLKENYAKSHIMYSSLFDITANPVKVSVLVEEI